MVLLIQIFTQFLPSIWIIFILILYEGLIGGLAYVNTFYKISKEVRLTMCVNNLNNWKMKKDVGA